MRISRASPKLKLHMLAIASALAACDGGPGRMLPSLSAGDRVIRRQPEDDRSRQEPGTLRSEEGRVNAEPALVHVAEACDRLCGTFAGCDAQVDSDCRRDCYRNLSDQSPICQALLLELYECSVREICLHGSSQEAERARERLCFGELEAKAEELDRRGVELDCDL